MKKIILFVLFFISLSSNAQVLQGGISNDYIPAGFFGSWGVVSRLVSSNNPLMFHQYSKDFWTLSGYANKLILENIQSGAYGELYVKDKSQDGKTLRFERKRTIEELNKKIVQNETVSFVLSGNKFFGEDCFIIEEYDGSNVIKQKSFAKYKIEGIKISGDSPK